MKFGEIYPMKLSTCKRILSKENIIYSNHSEVMGMAVPWNDDCGCSCCSCYAHCVGLQEQKEESPKTVCKSCKCYIYEFVLKLGWHILENEAEDPTVLSFYPESANISISLPGESLYF